MQVRHFKKICVPFQDISFFFTRHIQAVYNVFCLFQSRINIYQKSLVTYRQKLYKKNQAYYLQVWSSFELIYEWAR
jgi:hypothetical protein